MIFLILFAGSGMGVDDGCVLVDRSGFVAGACSELFLCLGYIACLFERVQNMGHCC